MYGFSISYGHFSLFMGEGRVETGVLEYFTVYKLGAWGCWCCSGLKTGSVQQASFL